MKRREAHLVPLTLGVVRVWARLHRCAEKVDFAGSVSPGSGVNSGRSSQKWQEIMHLRQASLQQSIHSHDPRPLAVSYPKVGVVLAGGLFSECHAPYLATSVIPGGGGLGDYPTG